MQASPGCLHRAATQPGGHVRQVEEDRRLALNELLDRAVHAQTLDPRLRGRIQLAPLIVDTFGCWGDTALSILQTCAGQFPPTARPAKLQWWRSLLSTALERENSRLLRCRAAESWGVGKTSPEAPPEYWGPGEIPFTCEYRSIHTAPKIFTYYY